MCVPAVSFSPPLTCPSPTQMTFRSQGRWPEMGGYLIDGMQVRVDARLCTSLPGMKGNPEGDRPAGKGGRG